MLNPTGSLRTLVPRLPISGSKGFQISRLLVTGTTRILSSILPETLIVPTPYGRFMTTKRSARVLTSIFDLVEPELQDHFRRCIADANIFFDVGAYHGWYTVKSACMMRKPHVILSFEPMDANFNVLVKNVQVNKLNHVVPLKLALADKDGYLKFEDHVVKCKRLDDIVQSFGIRMGNVDLVKIDVDGMGFEVLKGAEGLLREMGPALLLEIHNDKEVNAVNFLRKLDYSVKAIPGFGMVARKRD